MKPSSRGHGIRVLLSASLAASLGYSPGRLLAQDRQPSAAEAAVRAIALGFNDALARGDSIGALAMLSDDAVILEGGRTESKEQYRSGHVRADIAFAFAVKKETLADGVTVTGDVALYTRRYRSTGRYRDREIDRTSTEAMVLVRTADGWRIRQIHWQ
jgi:ketosteroid isomerase-like protein